MKISCPVCRWRISAEYIARHLVKRHSYEPGVAHSLVELMISEKFIDPEKYGVKVD